jgi:hypothetical protein
MSHKLATCIVITDVCAIATYTQQMFVVLRLAYSLKDNDSSMPSTVVLTPHEAATMQLVLNHQR